MTKKADTLEEQTGMIERYLDPTNDVAFKKVFMDAERLRGFLNAIMKLPKGSQIVELEFLPQEIMPQVEGGKRGMFDIKCKNENGKIFIIEMQNDIKPPFLQRVEFYGSHTYVSQIDKGISHASLVPVVVVAIVKGALFPNEVDCINWHEMREIKTNKRFLNALFYGFVELGKFKKQKHELKSVEDYWLDFLVNSPHEVEPPVTLNDPYVKKAYETVERFNWSKESYDAYLRAKLAEEAEALAYKEKEEAGVAKGKAEGIAEEAARGKAKLKQAVAEGEAKAKKARDEERTALAKRLIAKGYDIEEIVELTGLSTAELKKLKAHK